MELASRGSDVLQVAEDTAGSQGLIDLGIERRFALVREMMDGKTGDRRVKLA